MLYVLAADSVASLFIPGVCGGKDWTLTWKLTDSVSSLCRHRVQQSVYVQELYKVNTVYEYNMAGFFISAPSLQFVDL